MTTDDDIKAAEAHANRVCPEMGPEFCVWGMSKQDFLAGVAHARKPHVVADGDLPKLEESVLCADHNGEMSTGHLWDFGEHGMQWLLDNEEMGKDINEIKYWWPLPEVEK